MSKKPEPIFLQLNPGAYAIVHADVSRRGKVRGARAYEAILGVSFLEGKLETVLTMRGPVAAEGLAILGPEGEITRDEILFADEDSYWIEMSRSLS